MKSLKQKLKDDWKEVLVGTLVAFSLVALVCSTIRLLRAIEGYENAVLCGMLKDELEVLTTPTEDKEVPPNIEQTDKYRSLQASINRHCNRDRL